MKMSSEKKPYSEIVKKPRKKKEIVPVPEAVVYSTEKAVIKEKREIFTAIPVPEGWVRVMALRDYMGMTDIIYAGEVFDLPERRFKSLSLRGFVEQYRGDENPLNKR